MQDDDGHELAIRVRGLVNRFGSGYHSSTCTHVTYYHGHTTL